MPNSRLVQLVGTFTVGFHSPSEAFADIKALDGNLPDAKLAALAVSLFSLRTWSNFGNDHPLSQLSASMFLSTESADLELVGDLVRQLPEPGKARSVAGLPQLSLSARGNPKKRFEGVVEQRLGEIGGREVTAFTLHLKVKGFGFLGSDINYYGPAAICALVQRANQASRTKEDADRLALVVRATSVTFLNSEITARNQGVAATSIVNLIDREGYVDNGIKDLLTIEGLLSRLPPALPVQPWDR